MRGMFSWPRQSRSVSGRAIALMIEMTAISAFSAGSVLALRRPRAATTIGAAHRAASRTDRSPAPPSGRIHLTLEDRGSIGRSWTRCHHHTSVTTSRAQLDRTGRCRGGAEDTTRREVPDVLTAGSAPRATGPVHGDRHALRARTGGGRGPRGQRPARPAGGPAARRAARQGDRRAARSRTRWRPGARRWVTQPRPGPRRRPAASGRVRGGAGQRGRPAGTTNHLGPPGDRRLARSVQMLPRRPRRPRQHHADRPWRTPESSVRKRRPVPATTIGSALRHQRSAAVALELGELPDARRDVDTLSDLRFAHLLGTGPATASMLDPVHATPGHYQPVEVLGRDGRSLTVLADGVPESVPVRAYDGDPALLVPGRRLHAVRVAGALRCWA